MTQRFLWLLDAGHAPSTPGKRSPLLPDGRQLREYEATRAVVDRIAHRLERLGIAYHVLTPRTSFDLGPTARAKLANAVADAIPLEARLISVHHNAAEDKDDVDDGWYEAGGVTVFHYPGSDRAAALARDMLPKLVGATGLRDRGVRSAEFSILKHTAMPAILTESGFYTNRVEVELLLSDEGRDAIAKAHVQFIVGQETTG